MKNACIPFILLLLAGSEQLTGALAGVGVDDKTFFGEFPQGYIIIDE